MHEASGGAVSCGAASRRTERAFFRPAPGGADLSIVMDIRRLEGSNRNSGNHRGIMALFARQEQEGHGVCFVIWSTVLYVLPV
jgi:hypothetical protein